MKADLAQQHLLLELADLDAELTRLAHRAGHLPQQERYDQLLEEQRTATDRVAVLSVALEDLDAEIARLEGEVDAVRRREDRDRGLLDSGTVNPKQLEELQHELETLQRRQAILEDGLLEVMERREQLGAERDRALAAAEAIGRDADEARAARDVALAEVESGRDVDAAKRQELVARIDTALVDLYERLRTGSGGVGAGRLQAGRCGACRIELDRGELSRISVAAEDEVHRCPECRAILVRTAPAGR